MIPLTSLNRRVLACAALVTISACTSRPRALPLAEPDSLGLSAQQLEHVSRLLESYVESGKYAGIIGVIARNGRVGYEETFGWSDIERRKEMERDHVFRIYSMTKPVVAAGAMILVDQGKIRLDDPVARFIPAFENIKVFAGGTADNPTLADPDSVMTIRHLLTHTSGLAYGLTNGPVDTIFRRAQLYDPARTLEQFTDSLARLPLMFSPGTDWNYSSALDVVGRVIEVASGQPLDVFLEQELFRPLGMRDTHFRRNNRINKRLTTLYEPGDDGSLVALHTDGLTRMFEPEARFFWGSGGLLSTIDDYLRFAQMLLNGGEFDGVRVLSEQSVREMTRDQLQPSLQPVDRPPLLPLGYSQALGGSVLVDSTKTVLPGPNGIYRWSGYVGTYFWIDPANQLIAMVWTQLSPGRMYPLEDEFQRRVYQALVR